MPEKKRKKKERKKKEKGMDERRKTKAKKCPTWDDKMKRERERGERGDGYKGDWLVCGYKFYIRATDRHLQAMVVLVRFEGRRLYTCLIYQDPRHESLAVFTTFPSPRQPPWQSALSMRRERDTRDSAHE